MKTEKQMRIFGALILGLIFVCFVPKTVYAQTEADFVDPNPSAANRLTALGCLERANAFIAEKQWQNAYSEAELGIAYDSYIPDLWYVQAVSSQGLNRSKAAVIEMLATALSSGEWIQANRDSARLLYADLLADTCECEHALQVVNASTPLVSADADYVRARSFYRLGNVSQARRIVRNAQTLYPTDGRFPLLFFTFERKNAEEAEVASYAKSVIPIIDTWIDEFPELTVFAAPFSSADAERERLLKSFYGSGKVHQLYTVLALKYGIISQEKALDTMLAFASRGIEYKYLEEFVSLLTDKQVIAETEEWLTAFAGVLVFDVNNDDIVDLSAIYERGRASFIRYDQNQDGIASWQANCDFGVPYALSLADENINLEYGVYPSVHRVTSTVNNKTVVHELTAGSLNWSVTDIIPAPFTTLNVNFYIPVPKRGARTIPERTLVSHASKIEVPSTERANGSIRFTMFDGLPQSAIYSSNGIPYAYASFSDGKLSSRTVDIDDDGFFELTEFYAFDAAHIREYLTVEEEAKFTGDLFGTLAMPKGTYLHKTANDTDKDGRIEYYEEFVTGKGRIGAWDTDNDGEWNIRCTINGSVEVSQFIHPVSKKEITVVSEGGKPVSVTTARGKQSIYPDDFFRNVYWIGEKQEYAVAQQVVKFFNLSAAPGVSILDIAEGKRLLVVNIGSLYFGEVFEE